MCTVTSTPCGEWPTVLLLLRCLLSRSNSRSASGNYTLNKEAPVGPVPGKRVYSCMVAVGTLARSFGRLAATLTSLTFVSAQEPNFGCLVRNQFARSHRLPLLTFVCLANCSGGTDLEGTVCSIALLCNLALTYPCSVSFVCCCCAALQRRVSSSSLLLGRRAIA
jgi:hypothetical protein